MEQITNIIYINLKARTDRKQHIEEQLKGVGFNNFERFNAIKMPSGDGRIGCSMSHIKCLELAKQRGYKHVLICEDDTTFLNPELFKKQFNKFINKKYYWDVVLLAGNNLPPYKIIDDSCIRISRCQTTTCYLVNGHYFDILIANMKEGLSKLMHEPANHFYYAIDKYWLTLQEQHHWFLITPPTVIQREDYSDIEQKRTNYAHLMTDLNKPYLFGL
jgi:glycosyl transferase family 25